MDISTTSVVMQIVNKTEWYESSYSVVNDGYYWIQSVAGVAGMSPQAIIYYNENEYHKGFAYSGLTATSSSWTRVTTPPIYLKSGTTIRYSVIGRDIYLLKALPFTN
jgi:hypothetical protein